MWGNAHIAAAVTLYDVQGKELRPMAAKGLHQAKGSRSKKHKMEVKITTRSVLDTQVMDTE